MAVLAFGFALIFAPVLLATTSGTVSGEMQTTVRQTLQLMAPRIENKIFWPILTIISIAMVFRKFKPWRPSISPHIAILFAYLALAGLSIAWAFKPDLALNRYLLQLMIVICIVPTTIVASADVTRGLFACYGVAVLLNVFFVLNQRPIIIDGLVLGHAGYFTFKGVLGECAAVAILLALRELLYPGRRRWLGLLVIAVSLWLVVMSKSKGAFAIGMLAPIIAGITLLIRKYTRLSPALILLTIPLAYFALSAVQDNILSRLSYMFYGNYTLSGRVSIWDFARFEISRRPILGWGYQSFWLVGPDGPSIVDAPGWIKTMPSAHNGYLDVRLELGYVGYLLLLSLLVATVHATGRLADRAPANAWLLLSLTLFAIITNIIETAWFRGQELISLLFIFAAAEIGRQNRVLALQWPHASPLRSRNRRENQPPVTRPREARGRFGSHQRPVSQ